MSGTELPVGTKIREYEILETVGKGGMGAVYKARHTYLNKVRAIKIIRTGLTSDPEFVERFIREARILSELSHPNLVHLYEFGSLESGSFFMVLEFVEGVNLLQRIRQAGRITLTEAIRIIRDAACGLACAHEKGIIHRDVSPDNILLVRGAGGGEVVKVIDFGIARAFAESQRLTATHMFIGKPEYCSPEQCGVLEEGESIDHRTDIYSLGITFYHMLSGKLPFYSATPHGYLVKHATEPPKPIRTHFPSGDLPEEVDRVIEKMLAKKRRDRYSSMQAFLDDLDQIESKTVNVSSQVQDDPQESFHRCFEKGKESFDRKDWDEAVRWWRRAQEVHENPTVQEWISFAEQQRNTEMQLRNNLYQALTVCESHLAKSDLTAAVQILDQVEKSIAADSRLADLRTQCDTLRQRIQTQSYGRTGPWKAGLFSSSFRLWSGVILLIGIIIAGAILLFQWVEEKNQQVTIRRVESLAKQGLFAEARRKLNELRRMGMEETDPAYLELTLWLRVMEKERGNAVLKEAEDAFLNGNVERARAKLAELESLRLPGFEEHILNFQYRLQYASAAQDPDSESDIAERTRTALMWEIYFGNTANARNLYRKKSRINISDGNGLTPLMYAVWRTPELVDELIALGADVNARTKQQITALLMAADSGKLPAVQSLVRAGADVNAQNSYGSTPLILATMQGHSDIASLLLKAGADPDITTTNGYDALRTAQEYKRKDIERMILLYRSAKTGLTAKEKFGSGK